MHLSAALARLRHKRGWSRSELAHNLGISVQALCDIEKHRRRVSPARAYRWAESLGLDGLSWFLPAAQDALGAALIEVGLAANRLSVCPKENP